MRPVFFQTDIRIDRLMHITLVAFSHYTTVAAAATDQTPSHQAFLSHFHFSEVYVEIDFFSVSLVLH